MQKKKKKKAPQKTRKTQTLLQKNRYHLSEEPFRNQMNAEEPLNFLLSTCQGTPSIK